MAQQGLTLASADATKIEALKLFGRSKKDKVQKSGCNTKGLQIMATALNQLDTGLFCGESGKHLQMAQVFWESPAVQTSGVLRITALSVPHVPIYGFRDGVLKRSSLHTATLLRQQCNC